MGIDIRSYCRPFNEGTIYNPYFRPRKVNSPWLLFYMVKRGPADDSLDSALKKQALAAGVELRFRSRIDARTADIIASGPRGPRAIAAGITFETGLPNGVHVILNDDLAPKGYAYLLVCDAKATLATVLFERLPEARRCLDLAIRHFGRLLDFEPSRDSRPWGGYGTFRIPESAIRCGKLYVGEAAGFQDLLFGFGIRFAMVSGYLAAESILEQSDYDRLWQARLRPLLQSSVSNRYLYARLGGVAYNWLWHAAGGNADPAQVLRWLYSWTLSRKLVYPLARRSLH